MPSATVDGYIRGPKVRGPGLVVSDRVRQGRLIMWARRREKYGPSGFRPEMRERVLRGARAARATKLARMLCRRGHRWTVANTARTPQGSRRCRACVRIRRGHQRWAQLGVDRIERLREAMIAAHPDKGGSTSKFLKARQAYLAARKAA